MRYFGTFEGIGGFTLGIERAYALRNAHRAQVRREQADSAGEHAPGEGLVSTEGKGSSPTYRRVSTGTSDLANERPLCVGYSEIDKYATQIYQKHFPAHKNYGDITKINERDLPEFDFLVGGFPCQSFSIAGKRGGFNDTRGTLFFDIARILKAKQPRLLLLENVKGLLSHDEGKTFRVILSTLDELGYDLQWQVLNSKNFCVPQNRERVFIVGHLRGTARPQVFPFGESRAVGTRTDGQGNAYCLQAGNDKHRGTYVRVPEATKKGYAEATVGQSINLSVPNSATRRGRVSDLANTLDTGMQQYTLAPTGVNRPSGGYEPRADNNACTIKAGELGSKNLMTDGFSIRRLTPTECERLQGFPDGWTEFGVTYGDTGRVHTRISDTQRYKTLGNAVTVNVIEAVVSRMI